MIVNPKQVNSAVTGYRMARFRWDSKSGTLVDCDTGEALAQDRDWVPAAPMIIKDIEPYQSPATGRMVTSRSEQRYDLEASGCRIVEPSESPTKGKLRNPAFAKKHGLEHMLADDVKDAVRAGT